MPLDLRKIQASIHRKNSTRIATVEYACQHCQKQFHRNRPWQIYCTDECRIADYRIVTQRQYAELELELQAAEQKIVELEAEVAELKAHMG